MSQFTLLQKRAILSAVAAVGVHVAVLGSWVLLIIWDLPLFAYESTEQEPELESEVVMLLQPIVAEPEPRPSPPKPLVEKKVPGFF